MEKKFSSKLDLVAIIFLSIGGSSVLLGVSSRSGRDQWLALLLSLVIVLPVTLLYASLAKLMPEKGLYDMFELSFGKVAGKVFTALVTLYAIQVCAMALNQFATFIRITTLPYTPKIVIIALFMAVPLYLGKCGVEVFGKFASVLLIVMGLLVAITLIFGAGGYEPGNLLPILGNPVREVAKDAVIDASFPFCEIVLVLTLMGHGRKRESPYKIFIIAVVLGALLLLSMSMRAVMMMGEYIVENAYYPFYSSSRIVNVSNMLERMELILTLKYTITGIVKITLCFFAALKGFTRLFGARRESDLAVPVAVVICGVTPFVFSNIMETTEFFAAYPFYAGVFQLVIPLVLLVGVIIYRRKKRVPSHPAAIE